MTPSTALSAERPGRRVVFVTSALLCAVLGLLLQWVEVNSRFGGNWTALFYTGSKFPVPPALASERIYVFPNSPGYDGQMYHYVAHDPLMRTDIWQYIDNPRVRYRRILLPAMAFVLAFGRQASIDSAYVPANLLFLFLGAWWLSRYLDSLGMQQPQWAALFLLTPAALISLDRLAVDLTFTALCIGFALYWRLKQDARACAALTLACLSRDTGFVLAAAACLALLVERRFTKAATFATAVIPAAAWYVFVNLRTPDYSDPRFRELIPFQGILETLFDPVKYPFSGPVNFGLRWLDRLELLGFLLTSLLGVWLIRRNGFGPMEGAILLWSVIGLCLPRSTWEDCYAIRVFTPMMIYVMLLGAPPLGGAMLRWITLAPLLMVLPRVALQVLGPVVTSWR